MPVATDKSRVISGDEVLAPQPDTRHTTVLIVAPQPFYEDRGTPIAVSQVISALQSLGFRIDLLTYPVGSDLSWNNVSIIRCANPFRIRSVKIGFSTRKLILDALLSISLVRQLRHQRYDVIHAVEEMALPALLLSRLHKTRVMYDMQSSIPSQLVNHFFFGAAPIQWMLKRIEAFMVSRSDLIACSAGLIEHVRTIDHTARVTEWGYVAEQLQTPPEPGAVGQLRSKLGLAEDQPVVLYTGNFEPYQGLQLLLDSIPAIATAVPDVAVVLVGKAPSESPVWLSGVKPLLDKGQLIIVDRQDKEQVFIYLAMADILVSPREFGDNMPLKIFTYMAARRPVVATDIVAHRSLLDNDRGVLVEQNPAAMARGIIGLLEQPQRMQAIAESAYDHVLIHHTDSAFVDRLAVQYQRSMGSGRRSRKNRSDPAISATSL